MINQNTDTETIRREWEKVDKSLLTPVEASREEFAEWLCNSSRSDDYMRKDAEAYLADIRREILTRLSAPQLSLFDAN